MNGSRILIVLVIFLASALLCCGSARKPAVEGQIDYTTAATTPVESSPAEILPESIGPAGSANWIRKPDISVFAGESLFEYINGAAEMYHKYDFIDLHAAEYDRGDEVMTADIYRFEAGDMAFGMYTTLRPEEPDTVMLGIEGFTFDTNWIYVKGAYLVNVYTYDSVEMADVRAVAAAIEARLQGATSKPATFDTFPVDNRVPYSEKIYAKAFLSQDALSDVYALDYEWDDHRFTLFTLDDPGSAKLEAWRSGVEEEHDPDMGYQHLPYDGSKYLHTSDSYRGEIIAGPVGAKLVGAVGYRPEDMQILIAWLHALTGQP